MTTLKVFKESAVNALRGHIKTDLSSYQLDEPWVESLMPERSLYATTKISELPDDLLLMPDDKDFFDSENAKRVYTALHGLTLTQASDPRLWTYLTHVKYWKYMRKRWPIKAGVANDKVIGTVVSRYFLVGDKSRGLTRNGLARLWWAGHTCDAGISDGDRLAYTKSLFANQEVHAALMERAFSKNRKIIQPVLSVITKKLAVGTPIDKRENIRDLSKYLILLGGAMILDVLDPLVIEDIVEKFISELGGDDVVATSNFETIN